jgi:hypothetical protein
MADKKKAKGKASSKPASKSTKPAKAAAPAATDEVFGVASIAALLETRTGKTVKPRDLRVLLRKMARDGRLDREIVAGNRERWVWSGPDDPEVEKIIEAFENGELEQDKKDKLQALKDKKAAERAEKKAAEEADSEDDDEEVEEDDEEELEESDEDDDE